MAKREKKAWGRPNVSDQATDLIIARAHYVDKVPYKELGETFGMAKAAAHKKVQLIEEAFPEYVQFLKDIDLSPPTREVALEKLQECQTAKTEVELTDKLARIKRDLATAIEETIGHLLDMPESDLKSMKAEHKLRHIPELVKTMRLLREQSTENIQKLSLIKAVGIATARRRATATTD
jgi:hypothetical protein